MRARARHHGPPTTNVTGLNLSTERGEAEFEGRIGDVRTGRFGRSGDVTSLDRVHNRGVLDHVLGSAARVLSQRQRPSTQLAVTQ